MQEFDGDLKRPVLHFCFEFSDLISKLRIKILSKKRYCVFLTKDVICIVHTVEAA